MIRLKYIAPPYFICGVMDVMVGILRGLGYSILPMVVSLAGVCGLRLVWVAVLFPIYRSPETLYLSYPVSWLITGLFHIIFFLFVRRRAFAKVMAGYAEPGQMD